MTWRTFWGLLAIALFIASVVATFSDDFRPAYQLLLFSYCSILLRNRGAV